MGADSCSGWRGGGPAEKYGASSLPDSGLVLPRPALQVWNVGLHPAALTDFPWLPPAPQGSVLSERDYESLVMMRMRQAAERQQLIAQMQREDEVGQPT